MATSGVPASDVETERLLSTQLHKAQQQIESAKLEANRVAAEVQQLHRSMLDLTATISELVATNR